MTKEQLQKWLLGKEFGAVILVCPRCGKVDISPSTHLEQCDPAYESARQENLDHYYD